MPSELVRRAIEAFDAVNALDPRRVLAGRTEEPRELYLSKRVTEWVHRLEPNPSDALRLAARCQHLYRWKVPREKFERGRKGYLKWRSTLARLHADASARILRRHGAADELIERVRRLNLKATLGRDPEAQILEDALCLTFFEVDFADLAGKTPEGKMIDILRRVWKKMSPRARELAKDLPGRADLRRLLHKAVGRPEQSRHEPGQAASSGPRRGPMPPVSPS